MAMTRSELIGIYETEFAFIDQLEELLNQERQALQSRDADAITDITARKQSLLEHLEAVDVQRRKGTEALLKNRDSEDGLDAFINSRDESLKESLRNFQHENRINMGILELGRIFTADILAILRGQPHGHSPTYNTRGNRDNSPGTKSITKV